jgi:hypothetical protein
MKGKGTVTKSPTIKTESKGHRDEESYHCFKDSRSYDLIGKDTAPRDDPRNHEDYEKHVWEHPVARVSGHFGRLQKDVVDVM